MSDYDLMEGPSRIDAIALRKRADRVLFLHEFAVAYEYPLPRDSHRGYLTAWVRIDPHEDNAPRYEREQGMSGDDDMIRGKFSEMAEGGSTDRITSFIQG